MLKLGDDETVKEALPCTDECVDGISEVWYNTWVTV